LPVIPTILKPMTFLVQIASAPSASIIKPTMC